MQKKNFCLPDAALKLLNGFGLAIQTKSARILRDFDVICAINKKSKAVVQMTLTTFNENVCRLVEPAVSTTRERFETLMKFKEAGVPTIVWFTPVLPFINDTEENLFGILDYCKKAGVKGIIKFDFGVTLREGGGDGQQVLEFYFPLK